MDDYLLRQDGLGASLFLDQVVFAHEDPVGELGAGGENAPLRLMLEHAADKFV